MSTARPPGTTAAALDRDSPVALHRQLAQQLRDAIVAGTYLQGDRIPTEPALMALHGVSRITARQAVMQLVSEGLLVRRQGKGTYVTAPPVRHALVEVRGFYDELVARGVNPEIELLAFATRVPQADVAARLRSGGQALVTWKRLYRRQGEPFAVAWVYLAPSAGTVTRELAASHTSYQILETHLQRPVDHADISIRAQASTAEMRKLLRMPPSTPIIALQRVSYTADGTPVEYALYCAHADAYEYAFKVSSRVDVADVLARRAD
ncbi:MAG: GntR family transcriptional regulator [Burkholderiales bacterium]|nr:GntR family transcriptional regulator [Burkholderiales bacterium]